MVTILVTLVVVGVVAWLVNTYVPLAAPSKTVFNVVLVLGVCLWLLSAFGVIGPMPVLHTC